MPPKVSVIVPVYNVEKYLPQCLDSILAQTMPDWEAICVNDGSTDHSLDILNAYAAKDSRFKIFSQDNQGLGVTRNNALKQVTGEYVAFLDSDDWLTPEMLAETTVTLDQTHANMVMFDIAYYEEAEQKVSHVESAAKVFIDKYGYDLAAKGTFNIATLPHTGNRFDIFTVTTWTKVYRSDFIKAKQLCCSAFRFIEDNIFAMRAHVFAGDVPYINKAYYYYRQRVGALTNSKGSSHYFYVFDSTREIIETFKNDNIYTEYEKDILSTACGNFCLAYKNLTKDQKSRFFKMAYEFLPASAYYDMFVPWTGEEITIEKPHVKPLEKIFSLRNMRIGGSRFKLLTFFGCSFAIRKL